MKTLGSVIGNRNTVTVDRSISVVDAARLMGQHHIGALPVLDHGRLVGIFSERDVLTRVVAVARPPEATHVGDVMSSNLIVAGLDESCETCLQRMQRAHVRHLIVIQEGQLAGIISLRDLLAADIDEKAEAITMLSTYMYDRPMNPV